MKRLAVIDGKSVFYRGYYAMPNLSLPDGTPTGGVYGFTSLALELIKKLNPDYVAVAWDKKDTNIRSRRKIYPEYKAGRKKAPDDFYQQIPILHELLDAFGWPLYEMDDYEADDIMGAFARQAEAKQIETCLITSDLDALQLVSPFTKVYAMKNGLRNIEEFSPASFEEKYGIKTSQFLDLKSLQGDSSDNLPGVPGVGEKTALKLLREFKTLDEVYANLDSLPATLKAKLEKGEEKAYMTKQVAEIWTDAPVELDWDVADVNDCDFQKVGDILKRLEFRSLIRRLPKNMSSSDPTQSGLFEVEDDSAPEASFVEGIDFAIKAPIFIEFSRDNNEIFFSNKKSQVYRVPAEEVGDSFWKKIADAFVVSFDLKKLYHFLDENGLSTKFAATYDIGQADFLLEPLRRDHSLTGLIGDDALGNFLKIMPRLTDLFKDQEKKFDELKDLKKVANELDFPLCHQLFLMEKAGVKIDVAKLATMSVEMAADIKAIEQKIYTMSESEFNVASPRQLADVLFSKMQLPTQGIKKGKTGYSTGQKELNKLRGIHPIIELVEQFREISKIKNTYVDALPKLVDDNSRLHSTFNQNVTSTGRLSSTNPNLQNIPIRSELGRKLRIAFVAEKGNVLVNADYSQFELRLAAVLAKDQDLIDDFNSGIDIHSKIAAQLFDVDINEVSKEQRRIAKIVNFGVLYGMSARGLVEQTSMNYSESKYFIEHYFAIRKPIREYLDNILVQAKEQGFVQTFFGRRRPTPDIHSANFIVREAAKRAAMNMPIQGTEADLMKKAMLKIDEKIAGLGKQILQIHDSIMIECPSQNAEEIANILQSTMESVAPELKIKLKVDVSIGKTWSEL